MKNLVIIALLFSLTGAYSQTTKMIMIRDQTFQMIGEQYGEAVEKSTKNYALAVDYVTGEINGVVNLIELDLLNKHPEAEADPDMNNLKINGYFPLNELLYNQQEQQEYKIQLDLVVRDITVPVLFDFTVIYISNTITDFHEVRAVAPVNLLDFEIGDLNSFEPQVNIILTFQMLRAQR